MKVESYWDEENNLKNFEKLMVKETYSMSKADFDKKNNIIFISEQSILFDDAERILLGLLLIFLILLAGVLI